MTFNPQKTIDDYQFEKEWREWVRLPEWKKFDSDKINGIDDGEEPGRPHELPEIKPSSPQMARIFKLMEEGVIPF